MATPRQGKKRILQEKKRRQSVNHLTTVTEFQIIGETLCTSKKKQAKTVRNWVKVVGGEKKRMGRVNHNTGSGKIGKEPGGLPGRTGSKKRRHKIRS